MLAFELSSDNRLDGTSPVYPGGHSVHDFQKESQIWTHLIWGQFSVHLRWARTQRRSWFWIWFIYSFLFAWQFQFAVMDVVMNCVHRCWFLEVFLGQRSDVIRESCLLLMKGRSSNISFQPFHLLTEFFKPLPIFTSQPLWDGLFIPNHVTHLCQVNRLFVKWHLVFYCNISQLFQSVAATVPFLKHISWHQILNEDIFVLFIRFVFLIA